MESAQHSEITRGGFQEVLKELKILYQWVCSLVYMIQHVNTYI